MYKPTNEYVFERVYVGIKRLAISGELLPGERLHIERLACEFDVSSTPVREVLNRLVAEDIIDMMPKAGFFTKHISEVEIRDLLDLNQLLLDWSLDPARERLGGAAPVPLPDGAASSDVSPSRQLAKATGDLFSHIALLPGNGKVGAYVAHINDRLHYMRAREYEVIPKATAELHRLCALYRQENFRTLRDELQANHARRLRLLPKILKHMALHPIAVPSAERNHI
tara:strand:+ start:2400 stop:3077 length:678 start_codon:yes stop_codon:yes gene_type:complete